MMNIDLSKSLEIVLEKRKLRSVVSRVGLAIDISGSMTSLFRNGEVDALVKRTFEVADKFDDNHELDAKAFNHGVMGLDGITEKNLDLFVHNLSRHVEGGTAYAPPIKDFTSDWFGKSLFGFFKKKSPLPAFLIVQTDGRNDHDSIGDVEAALQATIDYPMFVFFLGLGRTDFPNFEKWSRFFKNVDYLVADELQKMTPEDFYEKLISQKLADFYHSHGVSVG